MTTEIRRLILESLVPQTEREHAVARAKLAMLMPRQLEVLQCAVRGMSIDQTADKLNVAWGSAAGYRKTMVKRMGVESIAQAVIVGVVAGLR